MDVFSISGTSDDGRFVVLLTGASFFDPGAVDNNGTTDVYLWDRMTGAFTLVSAIDGGNVTPDDPSLNGVISGDGNFIVFNSRADNLVTGIVDNNNATDFFLYDRVNDTLQLISGIDGGGMTSNDPNLGGFGANPAVISENGRYVVFASSANDLVSSATDTNGTVDIFLFDRVAGSLTLVSSTDGSGTTAGNGTADSPTISDNGQFVAYTSHATNIVGVNSDTNGFSDVFVYDHVAGSQTLVSRVNGTSNTGNKQSVRPKVSGDGNYVVFDSTSDDLVAGVIDSSPATDVYLFDRVNLLNILVTGRDGGNTTGNLGGNLPDVSDDGRYVVFNSQSTNLITGVTDSNGSNRDVFHYDRVADSLTLVSGIDGGTTTGDSFSEFPAVSGDGRYVVYNSQASNLVSTATDNNGNRDAYLYDRVAGTQTLASSIDGNSMTAGNGFTTYGDIADDGTIIFNSSSDNLLTGQQIVRSNLYQYDPSSPGLIRVSTPPAGVINVTANQHTSISDFGDRQAQISADGRYLVLSTGSSDLISGATDDNGTNDVYLYDRVLDLFTLVSHANGNTSQVANGSSSNAVISDDGNFIAFASNATDLVSGATDNNDSSDVFVYNRATGTTHLVSGIDGGNMTGDANSFQPSISANGAFLAFSSNASNLLSGATDTNSEMDVFVYDRVGDSLALASGIDAGSTTGSGRSSEAQISDDGNFIAFVSRATNLLSGITDTNGTDRDVFLYDRLADNLTLVSRAVGSSATANARSDAGFDLSSDGEYLAFFSRATDLAPGITDINGQNDVFVYERSADTVHLVSGIDAGTTTGNEQSRDPSISANGRYVAFESRASNLVTGVDDGIQRGGAGDDDVFLYDRVLDTLQVVSSIDGGSVTGNGNSRSSLITDDGSSVLFYSSASDLITGLNDSNTTGDTFTYRIASDTLQIVSTPDTGLSTGNGESDVAATISADGSVVYFSSLATDFVANDFNQREDTYVRVNQTPSATDDSAYITDEDSVLAASDADGTADGDPADDGVLVNDIDPDNDVLVVGEVNGDDANVGAQISLASGALVTVLADGTFTYDPNGQFESLGTGGMDSDSFTYTLTDGLVETSATATIQITGIDDPPMAVNDLADVDEDSGATTIDVLNNDVDADGGTRTIASATQPADGTVSIAADNLTLTYEPDMDACNDGAPTDDFTYTLNGGSTASVAVTVNCINDEPSFTPGGDVSVAENSAAYSQLWATQVSAGPANESGQSLNFNITSNTNNALFSALPSVLSDGTLEFTPELDSTGFADITVELMDDGGIANGGDDTSPPQMFRINVEAAADLVLTKSQCTKVTSPNQLHRYLIEVRNLGSSDAENVLVMDTLPADMSFIQSSPACTDNAGMLTCDLGTLAPGAMMSIRINVQVNSDPASEMTNTASVSSTVSDPTVGNNADEVSVQRVDGLIFAGGLEKACSAI